MGTTIQISMETRERLNRLRPYKRATYDEVLTVLTALIPEGDDEGAYTDDFRASLLRGLLDIRNGRTFTSEEVARKLAL